MQIKIQNVSCTVTECNDDEDELLENILQVPVPGARYMPAYQTGVWDGMKKFYSTASKAFPTGFLPFVIDQAHKKHLKVHTHDERNVPGLRQLGAISELYPHLRDYQQRALQEVFGNYLHSDNQVLPWQRGVLKFPTGSGKTLLACSIIDFIQRKTLYVIERKDLMYQTQEAFQKKTKMSVGLIGDGRLDLSCDITLAMAQTIRSKFKDKAMQKFFQKVDVLLIDEVQ